MNGFAGAFARTMRSFVVQSGATVAPVQPAERKPLQREELVALFELDDPKAAVKPAPLRDSEQMERQTMAALRGALYSRD